MILPMLWTLYNLKDYKISEAFRYLLQHEYVLPTSQRDARAVGIAFCDAVRNAIDCKASLESYL